MSKKAYVGVNGIARNVSNIYVGVNGVARKVVKGYVGVNGVARQFWGASAPSFPESWDFWSTLQEQLFVLGNYTVRKTEKLITYYAVVQDSNYDYVVLISPFSNGVSFSFTINGQTFYRTSPLGSFTDVNNITWYFNYQALGTKQSTISKDCRLNDNVYYMGYTQGVYNDQAPRDLLAKVYAEAFAEEYAYGQTYTFSTTDIRRTIRKAIGLFLSFGYIYSANGKYKNLSDNADTVVNSILTTHGSTDRVFSINISTQWTTSTYSQNIHIVTASCSLTDALLTKQIQPRYNKYGFIYWGMLNGSCIPSNPQSLIREELLLDANGNITPTTPSYTSASALLGIIVSDTGSGQITDIGGVTIGNWGMNL